MEEVKNEMTEEEKKLMDEEQANPVQEEPVQDNGSNGDTQAPMGDALEAQAAPEIGPQEADPIQQPQEDVPQQNEQRMFSQDELNAIVGKVRQEARAKAREEYAAELRDRYGVGADSEIDDLIGNGQRFDALNGEYESQSATLNDIKAENALLKSGVPEEKFDDVKAILAYKRLEVTPENIANELATHPEWSGQQQPQPPQPVNPAMDRNAQVPPMPPMQGRPAPSVVQKLGGEPQGNQQSEDEKKAEFMRNMFGR